MQVKVITTSKTYRFNQNGEVVTKLTEPFVKVEVDNREDVEALYDAMQEHLFKAFTYSPTGEINGLTKQAAEAIKDFMLVDNAWYLRDPEKPEAEPSAEKPTTVSVHEVTPASATVTVSPKPVADPEEATDIPVFAGFIPDQAQREILKELQDTAERLRRITPDPADKWQAQLQRQLNAVLYFGIDDVSKACEEGQERLRELRAKADNAGVPLEVITLNEAPPSQNEEDEDQI